MARSPTRPASPRYFEPSRWVTGESLPSTGMAKYVVMIRSANDPERTPREQRKARDMKADWRRELKKADVETWKKAILDLLKDGEPRTFNTIGVTLLDKTADILHDTPPLKALLQLVKDGKVEFTPSAPVYFRKVGSTQLPLAEPDDRFGILHRHKMKAGGDVDDRTPAERYEAEFGLPVGEAWLFLYGKLLREDVEAIVGHPVPAIGAYALDLAGQSVARTGYKGTLTTLRSSPGIVQYGTALRLSTPDIARVRAAYEPQHHRLGTIPVVLQPGTVTPPPPNTDPLDSTKRVQAFALTASSHRSGHPTKAEIEAYGKQVRLYWPDRFEPNDTPPPDPVGPGAKAPPAEKPAKPSASSGKAAPKGGGREVYPVLDEEELAAIGARAIPRKQFQNTYVGVGKSSDLHAYGYQIVQWFDPKAKAEIVEYMPTTKDRPRLTATTYEEQVAIHDALGAPILPRRTESPPEPARRRHLTLTPAEAVAEASKVYVAVNGSKNSIAAALWTLQQGRLDAVVFFRTEGACPDVTRSYVRAFAEAMQLGFEEGKQLPKTTPGSVIVTGHREGQGTSGFRRNAGGSVAPFVGASDAAVWAELDAARVRPHPTYVLGVSDPCPKEKGALERAAKKSAIDTAEEALAVAAVESGDFPAALVLFGDGEERQVAA